MQIPNNRKIDGVSERQVKLDDPSGGIVPVVGTFTPTLSAAGLTFTYTQQFGIYTKIGDLVFVSIQMNFTASGTASGGNLRLNNLPFSGVQDRKQRLNVEQFQNSGYFSADVSRLSFEINGAVTFGELVFKNESIAPLTIYDTCSMIIQGVYKGNT